MGTTIRGLMNALALVSAGIAASACGLAAAGDQEPEPLVIREQGSFAVGGTVITEPGTWDPVERGPGGQTLHGDHA